MGAEMNASNSAAEAVNAKRRQATAPTQSQYTMLQQNALPVRSFAPERQSMMNRPGGEIRYVESYCGLINCTWRGSSKDGDSGGWKEVLEHMRLHTKTNRGPPASYEL